MAGFVLGGFIFDAIRRAPCIAKNYGAILSFGRPFAETSNGKGAIRGQRKSVCDFSNVCERAEHRDSTGFEDGIPIAKTVIIDR